MEDGAGKISAPARVLMLTFLEMKGASWANSVPTVRHNSHMGLLCCFHFPKQSSGVRKSYMNGRQSPPPPWFASPVQKRETAQTPGGFYHLRNPCTRRTLPSTYMGCGILQRCFVSTDPDPFLPLTGSVASGKLHKPPELHFPCPSKWRY